jgi:hypothetical protein
MIPVSVNAAQTVRRESTSRKGRYTTSSVHTLKLTSVFGPKV